MFVVNSIVTALLTHGIDFTLNVENDIIYLTLNTKEIEIVHSILSTLKVPNAYYSEAQNVNGNTEYIFFI